MQTSAEQMLSLHRVAPMYLLPLKKWIQAVETNFLRKLLCITYLEHKNNDWVWSKVNFLLGPQEPLLATVKRWKLALFR